MPFTTRPLSLIRRGAALVCLAALVSAPAAARADEPLHEGFMAHVGSGSQGRHRLEASIDGNVIPLPGGGRLNGTHLSFGIGTDDTLSAVELDRMRVQLLRWSHVRLLGLRRERDEGMPLGIDLGGISMPLSIVGKKESRNWIIAHVGFDGAYSWYSEDFTAQEDSMGLNLSLHLRLDQQVDLLDRLSLRAWQQVSYGGLFGVFGQEAQLDARQQLMLRGAVGLYLDITRQPLYRDIPRTHPVSGEVTYRRSVNQGARWRWMIVRASGHFQPLGYVTGLPHLLFVATGFERRF